MAVPYMGLPILITISDFRRALQHLENRRLETQKRRQGFVVRVFAEGPEYIPESTGEPRPDTWSSVQRVLDRFNETGSFSPKDYHDLTYHSSYVLSILRTIRSAESLDRAGEQPRAVGLPPKLATASNEAEPLVTSADHQLPSADKPHQRVGSVSNAHVGSDFELAAQEYFRKQGIELQRDYPVELGLLTRKIRLFDLGTQTPPVLVECKSHKWTAGGSVPSAKMTVWNEAMYYFYLAPAVYRKVLFVLHDRRPKGGETLLSYYKRTYAHLIPDGVEFLEWDERSGDILRPR
jgi:hypothetical protein